MPLPRWGNLPRVHLMAVLLAIICGQEILLGYQSRGRQEGEIQVPGLHMSIFWLEGLDNANILEPCDELKHVSAKRRQETLKKMEIENGWMMKE